MINIDGIIDKTKKVVDSHKIEEGAYARYLWQNEEGTRKMGVNEYGCADAANILYTIGMFPSNPDERAQWIKVLRGQQNPETGLFYEGTHHTIHTTAHCLAALELFDAQPLYPLKALEKYLNPESLHDFLWNLKWDDSPWDNSHQGAGLFAALSITRTSDLDWKKDYFAWLREHADPETGLGLAGRHNGKAPLAHQLYGWFHYFFNHEFAHMPIPYPEKIIDSCIHLYKEEELSPRFMKEVGFMEIDWIFAMNRASRQNSYRFDEVHELIRDCAEKFLPWLDSLDPETDDAMNDLHMLFGAVCAVSELQIALPGQIESRYPLKNVLDRRPFI